jgi:hypothetical protein
MNMNVHPKTGLRYIMAFRGGKPYADVINLYDEFSKRNPWVKLMTYGHLEENLQEISADERNFVCMWGVRSPIPKPDRKAKFVQVWSEAYDTNRKNLISSHPGWLRVVESSLPLLDGLFCHTPWLCEMMKVDGVPAHVLPVGWDPVVMGSPDFAQVKSRGFMNLAQSSGHHAAKRAWAVPMMKEALGDRFFEGTGLWGKRVPSTLNDCVAYLYISHSDIQSFSTFRTWQAVASSAALIAEGGRDCWPMEEDDYVPIPTLTKENIPEIAEQILSHSDEFYLNKAKRLHEKFKHMTIDYVVNEYLVPASIEIMSK